MSNALNLGNIVLPGDGYPNIFGFKIPVVSGLEGAYLLADGAAMIPKNYAPGKSDATVIGAPTAGTSAVFDASNYLDTGIDESAEMTIISVARDPSGTADTSGTIAGNFFSAAAGGIALWLQSTTVVGNAIQNNANATVSVAADLANFQLVAFRAYTAALNKIKNITGNVSNTSGLSQARSIDATRSILLGRLQSGSFSGPIEQMLTLIYSRALTDAELDEIATWARGYCTAKGVTV